MPTPGLARTSRIRGTASGSSVTSGLSTSTASASGECAHREVDAGGVADVGRADHRQSVRRSSSSMRAVGRAVVDDHHREREVAHRRRAGCRAGRRRAACCCRSRPPRRRHWARRPCWCASRSGWSRRRLFHPPGVRTAAPGSDPPRAARYARGAAAPGDPDHQEERPHRHREGEGVEEGQADEARRRPRPRATIARSRSRRRCERCVGAGAGRSPSRRPAPRKSQRADDADRHQQQEVLVVEDAVLRQERPQPSTEERDCASTNSSAMSKLPVREADARVLRGAREQSDDRVEAGWASTTNIARARRAAEPEHPQALACASSRPCRSRQPMAAPEVGRPGRRQRGSTATRSDRRDPPRPARAGCAGSRRGARAAAASSRARRTRSGGWPSRRDVGSAPRRR